MLRCNGVDEVVWRSTTEKDWAAATSLPDDNLSVYRTILSRTETSRGLSRERLGSQEVMLEGADGATRTMG
jgi:hypothetical protein